LLLAIAKKSNDETTLAFVLTDLGYAYNSLGDYHSAITYNLKALKLFEKHNDLDGLERTCFAIGRIFDTQNEFEKAKEYYKKCENIATKLNNEGRQALALHSVAKSCFQLNELDEALRINTKALAISKKISSKNTDILCYKLFGNIYLKNKQMSLAKQNLLQAATIAKATHAELFYIKANYELAKIFVQVNQLKKAEIIAFESFEISKKLNYPNEIINIAKLLSAIYAQLNMFEKAYTFTTIATTLNDSINNDKTKNLALKEEFNYKNQKQEIKIEKLNQQKQISRLEANRKNLYIYSIIGAFVAILIIAYFFFRRFKDKKENEILLQKLDDAQLLLTAERRASESEIKAIKSQMNPHFFYNALNSIQGFIYSGQKENAAKALGLFSDLSRAVLESSRNTEICLADEIELLKNYLALETMRLPKIKFEIFTNNNIDLYDTLLPAMLLQPLVENAINHGLANKNDDAILKINFNILDDVLLVEIGDNGIGRKAAGVIRNRMTKKSASFSTTANMSRIELLNLNRTEKIEQTIIDKYNNNNEPTGTCVQIKIPIRNDD